jgi:hypothetical protein
MPMLLLCFQVKLKSRSMSDKADNTVKKDALVLILDYLHRTVMHHAMWFAEVTHQYGRETALELLHEVRETSYPIHLKRLSKILQFDIEEGFPAPLLQLPDEEIELLKEGVAVSWLSNDGIWFQAVEKKYGMFDAKRCNDSCWGQFSPLEAMSVKKLLKLPYRLYAAVNKQDIVEEAPDSFVFRMVECRVQSARRRKGMEDYPCKSAGIIEYRSFAETIDARITTECMACPPDTLPRDWYCGWKFTLVP